MISSRDRVFLQAAGLGIVAGMRTMTAPALVSDHLLRITPQPRSGTWVDLLRSPKAAFLLKLLALSEMAGDKLPSIPARTSPPALFGRAVSGAAAGGALCAAKGKRPGVGVVVGCIAAVLSTYGTYRLRRRMGQALRAPDPLIGLIEDILAVGGGLSILSGSEEEVY